MKSFFVIAIGVNEAPVAYVIHQSIRKTEQIAKAAVEYLSIRFRETGVFVNVTSGKVVRMTVNALIKELPGFEAYGMRCIEVGGMTFAERMPNGRFNFDCAMFPTQRIRGRLPPASSLL